MLLRSWTCWNATLLFSDKLGIPSRIDAPTNKRWCIIAPKVFRVLIYQSTKCYNVMPCWIILERMAVGDCGSVSSIWRKAGWSWRPIWIVSAKAGYSGRGRSVTVASEKDDQMSETMIVDRNLPNPHLFKPLLCTHAWHHPSPYYYLIFEAIGNPAWSIKQKSTVQALIDLSYDDFYIKIKSHIP